MYITYIISTRKREEGGEGGLTAVLAFSGRKGDSGVKVGLGFTV